LKRIPLKGTTSAIDLIPHEKKISYSSMRILMNSSKREAEGPSHFRAPEMKTELPDISSLPMNYEMS
jgi:hypothetical protein